MTCTYLSLLSSKLEGSKNIPLQSKFCTHQFLKKTKAIFYHGHRLNHLKEQLDKQSVHGVTIVVQSFRSLKEITLIVMEQ